MLADGGVFAPIWNVRDESVPWVARLTGVIGSGALRGASVHAREGRQFGPLFRRAERAEFRHSVEMTADTLRDVVRSRSRYLVAAEADRERMERRGHGPRRRAARPVRAPVRGGRVPRRSAAIGSTRGLPELRSGESGGGALLRLVRGTPRLPASAP